MTCSTREDNIRKNVLADWYESESAGEITLLIEFKNSLMEFGPGNSQGLAVRRWR